MPRRTTGRGRSARDGVSIPVQLPGLRAVLRLHIRGPKISLSHPRGPNRFGAALTLRLVNSLQELQLQHQEQPPKRSQQKAPMVRPKHLEEPQRSLPRLLSMAKWKGNAGDDEGEEWKGLNSQVRSTITRCCDDVSGYPRPSSRLQAAPAALGQDALTPTFQPWHACSKEEQVIKAHRDTRPDRE
ncbi:hypothetical protein VTI74DRAFT_1908 [Chaetomium olivicolor]